MDSHNSNPYPAIQPAPPRSTDDARPGARSNMSGTLGDRVASPYLSDPSGSNTPSQRAAKRQRTLVQVACEPCRKKKQKCDAIRPTCTPCATKGLECQYRAEANEPRGQALRNQVEALQTELTPMAEVFALLRTEPQHVAQDILRKIRNGVDVRTVLDQLNSADHDESMLEIGDLSDPTITSYSVPVQRREGGSALMTVNTQIVPDGCVDTLMPPELVMTAIKPEDEIWPGVAQRWTRLTSNDLLVSHLIHIYYEHQQWVCDFNNRALFLEDFSSGTPNLCSEILVNAILANACRASPIAPHRNDPWHESNPGNVFFQEARRLWHADGVDARDSVVMVQASLEMVYYHYANGQDKIGDRYLYDSIRMARNLGLFNKTGVPAQLDPHDRMGRAKAITVWSLFEFVSMTRLSMQLEPLLRTAPFWPFPYDNDSEVRERFHMKKWELARLENKVAYLLYGTVPVPGRMSATPMQIESLYQQLLVWYNNLYPDIVPDNDDAKPWQLLLGCRYHHILIALFRPWVTATNLAVDIEFYKPRAEMLSNASVLKMRCLVSRHMLEEDRNIFSYHYCPMIACNILDEFRKIQNQALLTNINEDQQMELDWHFLAELITRSPLYQVFLTCLNHLQFTGEYLYMAQLALRALQSAAEQSQVALPAEVWKIFGRFHDPAWTATAARHVDSSFAPGKTAQDADGGRLDELVEKWNQLTIESTFQGPENG